MMKICFVGKMTISFIKRDCEILSKYFNVDLKRPTKTKKEWGLCEYFSIDTRAGDISAAIKDAELYVLKDAKASAGAIKEAFNASAELRKKARKRMKKLFLVEKKEKERIRIITDIGGTNK